MAPKYLYRDYFKAKVYIIWVHGPLGLIPTDLAHVILSKDMHFATNKGRGSLMVQSNERPKVLRRFGWKPLLAKPASLSLIRITESIVILNPCPERRQKSCVFLQ